MSAHIQAYAHKGVKAPLGFQFCLIGLPRVAHLVVALFPRGGTPGPTLCGIDRFQQPPIGWGMADGSSDGGGPAEICLDCQDTREWLEAGAQPMTVKVEKWTIDMLRFTFANDGPGMPMTRQQRAWLDKLFLEAAR